MGRVGASGRRCCITPLSQLGVDSIECGKRSAQNGKTQSRDARRRSVCCFCNRVCVSERVYKAMLLKSYIFRCFWREHTSLFFATFCLFSLGGVLACVRGALFTPLCCGLARRWCVRVVRVKTDELLFFCLLEDVDGRYRLSFISDRLFSRLLRQENSQVHFTLCKRPKLYFFLRADVWGHDGNSGPLERGVRLLTLAVGALSRAGVLV